MNKQVQKLLESFDDSKRTLAKLMAAEDITVQVVNGAPTASFDPVTRVLTIPNWNGLNVDQLDLLIGHEVGHALFTNTSYIEKVVKKPGLMSYWNVIEDTRIERKMKEAFPGLKRIFYNAYEEFHKRGPLFRGTRQGIYFDDPLTGRELLKKFAAMKFIDRINALYKIGAFVDIPFSDKEQQWLERINRCNSTEDAMAIAEALYKEQKEQNKEQKKQQQQQKGQKSQQQGQPGDESDDEDGDGEESESGKSKKSKKDKNADSKDAKSSSKKSGADDADEDSESSSTDEDDASDMEDSESGDSDEDADSDSDPQAETDHSSSTGDEDSDDDADDEDDEDGPSGQQSNQVDFPEETDPTAFTDQQTQEVLKELAKQQSNNPMNALRHILIRPLPASMVKDRTVTAADWTTMTLNALGQSADVEKVLLMLEQRWNQQFLSTAKTMALEFERRKTAKTLTHAKIAKTGRLNMTKLSQYKFTDDLFNRVLNVPQGKSHGIVMTIDASGSMTNVFPHVLDQVLLFAHFAYQCQIPFEAYMFTDVHHNSLSYSYEATSLGPLTLTPSGAGRLVGLINTMDRRTFKNQVKCVLALRAHYSPEHDITRNYPGAASSIGQYRDYGSSGKIPFGRLGGTPLFIGMMLAERHVERMKRTMKLDKMTNVLITDGEDTNGLVYETQDANMRSGNIYNRFQRYDQTALIVRDTVTKKNHILVDAASGTTPRLPQNAMMTLLFDVIKNRHDARNIMLFLADSSSAATTIQHSLGFLTRANAEGNVTPNEVNRQISQTRQFTMPKNMGVADLTLAVPTTELRLSENDFANMDTTKMTATQVGKAFTEKSVRAISNRVFVNTVMPFLA